MLMLGTVKVIVVFIRKTQHLELFNNTCNLFLLKNVNSFFMTVFYFERLISLSYMITSK